MQELCIPCPIVLAMGNQFSLLVNITDLMGNQLVLHIIAVYDTFDPFRKCKSRGSRTVQPARCCNDFNERGGFLTVFVCDLIKHIETIEPHCPIPIHIGLGTPRMASLFGVDFLNMGHVDFITHVMGCNEQL